jgi:DNA-directed RNA polymerase subunit RPC12/RpoP
MQATGQADGASTEVRCQQCGGVLLYDPAASALKCKHCKAVAPPSALAPTTPGPREIPLQYGMTMARTGLGTPMSSVTCNECGATVQLGPNERSTSCVYCASPMVVASASTDKVIGPESLIPFSVAQDRATDAYKDWLKGLWFRPSDLSKLAKLEQVLGIYVPYWTFDADVRSRWSAERGWHYQEREVYEAYENGQRVTRERTVTKTRWEPASGWREDHYDDVLVCGSKGMPPDLVDKLCTFDTQRLLPYSPGYLLGWRAESYAVDLPNAWVRGQEKINVEQNGRCERDIGGDTHRNFNASHQFGNETFKHILLPVYVAAYRYNGKPFQVLVNGQTAEVVGKAPWSFWKIAFLVLAILAVIAALVVLTRDKSPKASTPPTATTTAVTPPPRTPTPPTPPTPPAPPKKH